MIPRKPSAAVRSSAALGGLLWLAAAMSSTPTRGAETLAQLERDAFRRAVESVAPAVVQIRTVGGREQVDGTLAPLGPTTGLLISPEGYLVSSAFNFAQRPSSILVRMPDGTQQAAAWVGSDLNRMLVLLKVEPLPDMPRVTPAPVESLQAGQWAIAVGRTFVAEEPNVSVGIVSQLGRMHGRVVQTDAAISTANYGGPLIDVAGRVIGILAPMSPQASAPGEVSEVAGAEYYDSGIGFAVPLQHILDVLPRWIEQGELRRGVAGIGMVTGNPHVQPPRLTSVWPESPAAEAGWRAGDTIVEVEGQPVATQTQLRFQLVPRYAGETLQAKLHRPRPKTPLEDAAAAATSGAEGTTSAPAQEGADGPEEEASAPPDYDVVETEITLAAELAPYRHAFLGILPEETSTSPEPAAGGKTLAAPPGLAIRGTWPDSPAAAAGVQAGDRWLALDEVALSDWQTATAALRSRHPGQTVTVRVRRGEEELALTARLAATPTDLLDYSAIGVSPLPAETEFDSGAIKLPDLPQQARYFLPEDAPSDLGLLLWLGVENQPAEDLPAELAELARTARMAVVVAGPADGTSGWTEEDLPFLARLLPLAIARTRPMPPRIVVAGPRQSGQIAYKLAFARRGAVAGVAALDSPLPRTMTVPSNDPDGPLAVFAAVDESSPLAILVRRDVERLREAGYPATLTSLRLPDRAATALAAAELRDQFARWLLGLGRW